MALLVRVLRNQIPISIAQWVPVCSWLVPLSPTQGQWGRALSGIFQGPQMSQSLACGGSEQISGIDIQLSRKYHTTNKLSTTKDFPQPVEEKVGAFTKIIEAMGFTGPLKYSKWKIKIAALRMYTSCVKKTDFEEFFLRCQMPDTFNSWFLITLLHVWMCLVRMKQEGRTGKYMCRIIVHFMWEDVEQRGRVMGGILSDDHGLAAALWRTFFNQKCEDPRQLELLVEYVRKQIQYLDSMNGEDLLLTGEVSWRPLVEKNPQSVLKPLSPVYNDEGL
ncbi:ubiquinol-cytochrome-c reductase complex assembly factor 1 isoform X2 [Pipistrellus kuhlii]|uniref:Ubiquinol-cytochrome c reductase complex assembly factor 1 n=1 Tax=Pipistrellus kuhlii TaxID=59472 RepID=A0A7J7YBC2_PIPKU|nr:ubiquinol-cytochrome-c reductase complex assembly factor 1 isoform X2 [Pipistrellus kuhlii]KAF6359277.1 ubiquinol-cytochrome c reductase complex assembly factor 1 [Pipistrellus kuhlii]